MHKDITEVNLSAYMYRVFHEDFFSVVRTNTILNSNREQLHTLFILTIEEKYS